MKALDDEHLREADVLYQEQLDLREELARAIELLQTEIIPREKAMHDMMERMQATYQNSMERMHAQLTGHLGSNDLAARSEQQRQEMLNPMWEMESELARISNLLGHQVVTPDIQGWSATRPQASPGRAAAPAWRGAASSAASPWQPAAAPSTRTGVATASFGTRRDASPAPAYGGGSSAAFATRRDASPAPAYGGGASAAFSTRRDVSPAPASAGNSASFSQWRASPPNAWGGTSPAPASGGTYTPGSSTAFSTKRDVSPAPASGGTSAAFSQRASPQDARAPPGSSASFATRRDISPAPAAGAASTAFGPPRASQPGTWGGSSTPTAATGRSGFGASPPMSTGQGDLPNTPWASMYAAGAELNSRAFLASYSTSPAVR